MRELGRLLRLLGPGWRYQAAGILLGTIVILANAGLLALSGWFIAAMGLAGLGLVRIDYFVPAAVIRALAIIRTVGRYLERLVTHEATFRLISDLRVWFYTHLEPLAPAGLQRHRAGDLLSRIRADIDSLDNFYLRVLAPSITGILCVILIVGLLARFSQGAALVDLAGLALVGIVLPLATFQANAATGKKAVALRGQLHADIADTVRGFEELQIFGALKRQTARHEADYAQLTMLQKSEARVTAAASEVAFFLTKGTMIVAFAVAIPLAVAATLPGPDVTMIMLLAFASFEAVNGLPGAYRALGETLAAARRIFEIVDSAPAVRNPAREAAKPDRFDITFRDVSFRYGAEEDWVLRNVSFHIPAGSSLGIIGPTGSGKTSLGNVLLRFWDFQKGDVLLGDVRLHDLSGETVRSFCAVIAQQVHLFNTSIAENLRIAKPTATKAEMMTALHNVGILEEIEAMPQGLNTIVGETGAALSGGQARRIAIARAFLKNAPILILDEPTEGLDATSERVVTDALAQLMRGRTSLLITHRTQVLRSCDRMLRLDRGRVHTESYGGILSDAG